MIWGQIETDFHVLFVDAGKENCLHDVNKAFTSKAVKG